MKPALVPKHVATVVKYQKDPLRALEMFNSAAKEDGYKHTMFTYKCMVEKLGFRGEFEATCFFGKPGYITDANCISVS